MWTSCVVSGRCPREASKSDRLNQVPFPALALQILNRPPTGRTMISSSTTGSTPVSGFSKAKKRCDRLCWRDGVAPSRSAPDGCVRNGTPEG